MPGVVAYVEEPLSEPLVWRTGLLENAVKTWTVVEASPYAAKMRLADELNIVHGACYYDAYGNVPDMTCIIHGISVAEISPAPLDGTGMYRVRAEYGQPRRGRTYAKEPGYDLQPIKWIEESQVTKPVDIDVNGKRICNTVGEPLEPVSTRFDGEETLVMQWYVFSTTYASVYTGYRGFRDKLNEFWYEGAPPGCLLCTSVQVEDANLPTGAVDLRCYRLTVRLTFREPQVIDNVTYEGWSEVRPNVGRRLRNPNYDPAAPPEDPNSQQWIEEQRDPSPISLDGEDYIGEESLTYLEFKHYEYANFGDLVP